MIGDQHNPVTYYRCIEVDDVMWIMSEDFTNRKDAAANKRLGLLVNPFLLG